MTYVWFNHVRDLASDSCSCQPECAYIYYIYYIIIYKRFIIRTLPVVRLPQAQFSQTTHLSRWTANAVRSKITISGPLLLRRPYPTTRVTKCILLTELRLAWILIKLFYKINIIAHNIYRQSMPAGRCDFDIVYKYKVGVVWLCIASIYPVGTR